MLLVPSEVPAYLANEADVIAEATAVESEAAGVIVLVAVVSESPWGARLDPGCRRALNAQACAVTFVQRWREAAAVCGDVERRFSYWNTGSCERFGALTRRQMRVYRAAMRQM